MIFFRSRRRLSSYFLAAVVASLPSACKQATGEGCAGETFANDADPPQGEVWRPRPGTTWQWQLSEAIDSSIDVDMYDVDLVDISSETIKSLQDDGRIVICYFSAGSFEDWRPDARNFEERALGKKLDQWEGEKWLDIRCPSVKEVISARLDLAMQKGCDGVEPDNVDGYDNDTGFDISSETQLRFNQWLADAAHARGLSVGLKNDLAQVEQLENSFDWALNEECLAYDECDLLSKFVDSQKAVFHVEYVDDKKDGITSLGNVCSRLSDKGFSSLVKEWDLDAWRLSCD